MLHVSEKRAGLCSYTQTAPSVFTVRVFPVPENVENFFMGIGSEHPYTILTQSGRALEVGTLEGEGHLCVIMKHLERTW